MFRVFLSLFLITSFMANAQVNGGTYYNPISSDGGSTGASGTISLQSTYVGYGSGVNTLTGNPSFTYNAATGGMSVNTISTTQLIISSTQNSSTSISNSILVNGARFFVSGTLSGPGGGIGFGINTLASYRSGNVTAFGNNAGSSFTTGSTDTFIGLNAGTAITTAAGVTAVGHGAYDAATTCNNGTALGANALGGLTTAACDRNTALGNEAGFQLVSGYNNIFIGESAARNQVSGTGNIGIGQGVAFPSTSGSNQLNIGNAIYGSSISTTGAALMGVNVTQPSVSWQVSGSAMATTTGQKQTCVAATEGSYVYFSTFKTLGICDGTSVTYVLLASTTTRVTPSTP